jgi:hypothetical protein
MGAALLHPTFAAKTPISSQRSRHPVCRVLRHSHNDTIKEYARLGGDMLKLDR